MRKEQLILASRLSEIARLHSWLEELGTRYAIAASTQFAMAICLEEVVTNIIRHGYAGNPDLSVTIGFSERDGRFQLEVEDQAPLFNPLEAPLPDLPQSAEDVRVGGQGIPLLRKFADAIEYQPLERGNRLTMGFLATRPSLAVD